MWLPGIIFSCTFNVYEKESAMYYLSFTLIINVLIPLFTFIFIAYVHPWIFFEL
jgi:hypothetical protein